MKTSAIHKTLLAVGDDTDNESFLHFRNCGHLFEKLGCSFKSIDYNTFLSGKYPSVETQKLTVFLFFPFKYWDKYIETPNYKGIYGNKSFFDTFKGYWKLVDTKIKKYYQGKELHFINQPNNLSKDRDKVLTKRALLSAGLYCPESYIERDTKSILKLLSDGKKIYIKVRYGSMGKGITYLQEGKWVTNFSFKNGEIISRKSDYGWRFSEVTNNNAFLSQLLKTDVTIEEAIPPWVINNKRFDLRSIVLYDKTLYTYARSNHIDNVTTNISQGGQGDYQFSLKVFLKIY